MTLFAYEKDGNYYVFYRPGETETQYQVGEMHKVEGSNGKELGFVIEIDEKLLSSLKNIKENS